MRLIKKFAIIARALVSFCVNAVGSEKILELDCARKASRKLDMSERPGGAE